MVKVYCDKPQFNVIDLIADHKNSVITVEYSDEIEDRFETFVGLTNAQVEIIAVMNVSFENDNVDEDGRVDVNAASADIVSLQIKSRIIDSVEEELYEEVQLDINDAMLRSLVNQRFSVRIEKDE